MIEPDKSLVPTNVVEGELVNPASITDLVDRHLSSISIPDEDDRYGSPVGAIIYAEGKRALGIANTWRGRLLVKAIPLEDGFNPNSLTTGRKRFLNLPHLSDIAVAQIGMRSGVKIQSFPSIHTRPSVAVSFNYRDLATDYEGVYPMDEPELLSFLTSPPGRLAVFEGAGFPESNALVFEQSRGDEKHALAFFIHPEDDTFNSVEGVFMFFKTLNDEFSKAGIVTPYQNKILERLDRNIESGALDFNLNSARVELFKSILIAHARIADGRGRSRSQEILGNALLPSWLLPGPWGKIMVALYKRDLQRRADGNIESFLLNPTPSEGLKGLRQAESKHNIVEELKTPEALDARLKLGSEFGKWPGDQSRMKNYLKVITDLVKEVELPDEFADVELMLQEVHSSPFYRRTIPYNLRYIFPNRSDEPKSKSIIWSLDLDSYELRDQPVSNLVIALRKELERRKQAIEDQIHKADQQWN